MVTFKRGSFLSTLNYMWSITRRKHQRLPDTQVTKRTVVELSATSEDTQIPYQLDGDFAGYLPVKLSILPGRVRVLLPPNVCLTPEADRARIDEAPPLSTSLAVTCNACET